MADNSAEPTSINSVNEHNRLADEEVRVRTLHLPENPGFGAACNELAKSSDARWLFFVNPDAETASVPFDPNTLFAAGTVTGATQVTTGDSWSHCAGQRYLIRDELARSWFRRRPAAPPSKTGGGYVSGGAFVIERSRFLELGGFDEKFFLFYEDIDLCLRAHRAGQVIRQAHDWIVVHDGGHATKRNWGLALHTSYVSGRYFHAKHGEKVRWYDAYVAVDAGVRSAAHALRRFTQVGRSEAEGANSQARAYRSLCALALGNFQRNSPIS